MAKKINFIKLVKLDKEGNALTDKEGNLQTETFFTPTFIPFRKVYEATEMLESAEQDGQGEGQEEFKQMLDFVVETYQHQFTTDDLLDRLHAPNGIQEINKQVEFVAQGTMDDERKKELARMI